MLEYGCQSMTGRMTHVAMRFPGDSLRMADPNLWHYNHLFDADKAIAQYQKFAALIEAAGCEISWMADNGDGLADAMFVRDASLVTKHGVILLSMGKPVRKREPRLHRDFFLSLNVPILGELTGRARIEGGDLIWLDSKTLVVGVGFRSNIEGVRQLRELLKPYLVNVLWFDLPVWSGEAACLHLMSVISPVSTSGYLVEPKLIPARLWQLMKERNIELISGDADEFARSYGLNLNVLPVSPGHCIMVDGFPKTRAALEERGIKVYVFEGDALCMACEGGPTCLTNPIRREDF